MKINEGIQSMDLQAEKKEMEVIGYRFLKTDRNGTNIYVSNQCSRCGGAGYINIFNHVEGGVCFSCNGTGTGKTREFKLYTPEYFAKLEAKRFAKRKEKAEEENKAFFEKMGFSEEGKTWVVLGDTFKIRGAIKDAGGKFDSIFGWHLPIKPLKWDALEIAAEEVFECDTAGNYRNDVKIEILAKIENANNAANAKNSKSEYVCGVGVKISKLLTLTKICSFETQYGTTYIYNFVDDNENVFIWKTATVPKIDTFKEGVKVVVTGKVKEHKEYKGIRQNILTRCKIAEV